MAGKRKVLDLERYVPALLTFVSNKLSKGASSTYLRMFGIGVTEWRVIAMLAVEPNITANRICQVIDFDKALVSRSLQVLEGQGYVTVKADELDNRRRAVCLTRAGYGLHDDVIKIALERERRLLVDFSKAEIDAVVKILRRLHDNLEYVNSFAPDLDRSGMAPRKVKRKKTA